MAWFPHYYAPRKRAATIHAVYIADGLADDCEELIHRCCQAGTLNFNVFSNIWKDMNFALIFYGRTSGAELAELSEEALQVAKRYLVQDTTNFEETVASLFLIYSILHLQPVKRFAPLRVVPDDLEAIFRIEDTARQQNRHDVLYILASVLIKGPCQFHFGEREYGMDTGVRKYFDTITSIDKYGTRPKGVFYRQTEELDLLRELSSLGRRYARAKILDGSDVPDKTLRYTDEHLPNELAASLKQLIDGDKSANKSNEATIQSLKERAMWNTIQEMRHMKRLPERKCIKKRKLKQSNSTSPTKSKTASSKKNTKTKSGSPKNPLPTNSPKKNTKTYKSKSIVSTSSSDYESCVLSDNDSDDNFGDSDEDFTADDDEGDAEINLDNLKTIDEYINRIKSCPQTVTSENAQASTSDSNLQYEIEIQDYMNVTNAVNESAAGMKETNKKTNKKQKTAATKSKTFNKTNKLSENKDADRDQYDNEEINLIEKPICKPVRNAFIRKKTNHKSPLRKSPKGSSKCEAMSIEDIEVLPQTEEAQSLSELTVLEIAEGIEKDIASMDAVKGVAENLNIKKNAVAKAPKRKK